VSNNNPERDKAIERVRIFLVGAIITVWLLAEYELIKINWPSNWGGESVGIFVGAVFDTLIVILGFYLVKKYGKFPQPTQVSSKPTPPSS